MKKDNNSHTLKKVGFKVKIKSCLSELDWYFNKVGKIYSITQEGFLHYYFRNKSGTLRAIFKNDCKKLKS